MIGRTDRLTHRLSFDKILAEKNMTCPAVLLLLLMSGYIKYAVEMGSVAMIHIINFIKIGPSI
jgi:hypothetical protein